MLKFYTALLLALFTPQTQVLEIKQVQNVLAPSVVVRVKVWRQNEDTNKIEYNMGGCSGTYIGPYSILTAAHCFAYPSVAIWVKGQNQTSRNVYLVKIDPSKDLAILSTLDSKPHVFAKLANTTRVGETVVSVGNPLNMPFLVSEGIAAQINYKDPNFKSTYLIHTAMINPGSSGGGAFNAKGELIGVNAMTMGGPFGWAGISMAVDSKTIREFLK